MLFHLACRFLTLDVLEGHSDIKNFFKNIFLPMSIKICILVFYRILIKKLNSGVNQYTSGHVISQNVEFIKLAIF